MARAGVASLPHDDEATRSGTVPFHLNKYERARTLTRRTASLPLSVATVLDALEEVRVDAAAPGGRTLWRTLFDLDARTMEARFYLGDESDGSPRRSPELMFSLS